MEELSKELTKRMAKDLRTAKTYHVGKKSFIKLAKDYCEYELPKMKDIAFTQYATGKVMQEKIAEAVLKEYKKTINVPNFGTKQQEEL